MCRFSRLAVMFLGVSVMGFGVPILTFNEATGSNGANQNQNVGWQFNVVTSLTVTGLGWFDEGQNGLGISHEVGIWNSSGTLLTSAVVPAGTVAVLDGQFRMVPITPIVLAVGTGYIVGGLNTSASGDRLAFDVTQVVDARITFVDATFSELTATFGRPTQFSVATTGFYGPMFAAGGTVVPEPGSLLMLLSGIGIVAAGRSRARQ